MTSAIEARNLVKKFGNFTAVNNISFKVSAGETFGILGENGAGKSTTMRIIACRSPVTSGVMFVEGMDVKTHEEKIRSVLGIVPQENNLDPDINVLENLLVYSRYFRLSKEFAKSRSEELLDFIRLSEKSAAKVDHLSGGMKRRLIIARALLHRPKILLLDEPTTGLDPHVRQEIWEKLEELRRRENLTIVLSTHYMEEAEKLCKRLIIMEKGEIIAEGIPGDLIKKNVKRYALEIREADGLSLLESGGNILSSKRGSTHFYFAENPDELTPLIESFGTRTVLLRPSNLEDVFLNLVKK
jgi:lipooligosaccharide transport system ATP-binding protein